MVDERYVEHRQAGEWLRVLLDGEGRSVGTAHTYAGRIALYLTWATAAGVDPLAPTVEQLAAFARWLERTPSRKHRPGRDRRLAPRPGVVTMTVARSPATVDGILIAAVDLHGVGDFMPAAASVKVPLQRLGGLANALGEGVIQLLAEPARW